MKYISTIILVFLVFTIGYSTNFWQPTSLTLPAAIIAAPGGKLFYMDGTSVYRSTNNGTTWDSLLTLSGGITFNGIIELSNGHLLVATKGAGMIHSTDHGSSWSQCNTGFTSSEARRMTLAPSGDIFIGTPDNGVFRSTDEGAHWTQAANGLLELNIGALAINTSGELFAGVKGSNGVYKSTDNGANWTKTSMTQSLRIYSLDISSNGYIYASSKYDAPNSATCDGIYRSSDDGATWSRFGLAGRSMNNGGMCFGSNSIYAVTDSFGVWRTTNDGATWDSVNTGLPTRYIVDITQDSSGYLYAGTYAGVFKSVQAITSVVEPVAGDIPTTISLHQNYPNPFNPTTDIRYSLSVSSFVSLKVYNAIGQEVETLLEGAEQPVGTYQATFDASRLSSGIYYYRLNAIERASGKVWSQAKSMILTK